MLAYVLDARNRGNVMHNDITTYRKRAALLRQYAQNARDVRIKQQYARDADDAERRANELQELADELAHGPYLGGTPTGNRA